jgi:hypothetical protein
LRSQLLVVRDDLHDLSQQLFVLRMVIWIDNDTFSSVRIEVLKVG